GSGRPAARCAGHRGGPARRTSGENAGARSYGARVFTYDRHRDDREKIAADLARRYGYMIIPSSDAVPVMAMNRHVSVIGVEPESGADTAASLRAGSRMKLPEVPDTIADALRHTSPAPLAFQINKRLLDGVVTVSDGQIAQAMRWAFELLKIVVEPSGAVTLAALTEVFSVTSADHLV